MTNLFYSKKFYYALILIVLGLWLVNSFIPMDSCSKTWQGAVHWDSCEGMNTFVNGLYVLFQSVTILATVFLLIQTIVLFKGKFFRYR